MASNNREERLQMRQRGAGSRQIKQVDFGFSFGLAPPPAESDPSSQPASQPTVDAGAAIGPSQPPQPPLAIENTRPTPALPIQNDTASKIPVPVQRTPGSARNALPERPSTFDIPPDEPPDIGRSSKRRRIASPKLGLRMSSSQDSSRQVAQTSQTVQNGIKPVAPPQDPAESSAASTATTAKQTETEAPQEPPTATVLPMPDATPAQPVEDRPSDANDATHESPTRQEEVSKPNGTESHKEDDSRKRRGSSVDKPVAKSKSPAGEAQKAPAQEKPTEPSKESTEVIRPRETRQRSHPARSASASPRTEKEPSPKRARSPKGKVPERNSPKQQESSKSQARNGKKASPEAPPSQPAQTIDAPQENGEDRRSPQQQKEASKPEKRAGRPPKKASQTTEPAEDAPRPVARETRKRREPEPAQPLEQEQENEPEAEAAGRGKRKRREAEPAQAQAPGPEAEPETAGRGRKRRGAKQSPAQEPGTEPQPQAAGKGKRKQRDVEQETQEEEPEPEPQPTGKGKGKQRATGRSQQAEPEPEPQPAARSKKKRKEAEREQAQAQEPEPEPEQEPAPEPSSAPKRGRGRPSVSTKERQPQAEETAEPQADTEEAPARPRKTRQPRGETVPVQVHRLANVGSLAGVLPSADSSDEDPESADELETRQKTKLPGRGGVNAADVLGQICRETLEKTLNTLKNGIENEANNARRAEWTRKKKAVEAFGSELEGRLFELSEMLDSNFVLGVKLRKAKREMMDMRSRLYQIRKEREGVALQMDAVRQKYSEEERARMSRTTINNSLHSLDLALERSQKPDDSNAADASPTAGLEFLLRSVAENVSSRAPGAHGGLLNQIKSFNAQLEAAAQRLEG